MALIFVEVALLGTESREIYIRRNAVVFLDDGTEIYAADGLYEKNVHFSVKIRGKLSSC